MSASTAELTLIIRAQNLAEGAFNSVKTQMQGVVGTARVVASDMANAFKGIGKKIAGQLGNIATDILSGGSLANNMVYLGATMAGAVAEGLSAHLLPMLLAKVAGTAVFAPLAAEMAAGGVTLGTVLGTAIGVGVAALPFVLLAAAVAALVYLATNAEARNKAREVALMILGRIGDGLRTLGGIIIGAFRAGLNALGGALGGLFNTVVYNVKLNMYRVYYAVKGVVDKIIKAIKDALAWLGTLINGTHEAGRVAGSLISKQPGAKGNAEGGWVGLHGPELRMVGERGKEYITPNSSIGKMGSSGGFTIQGISEREIVEMVERGFYFKLNRSAASRGRV
jgi:hypothetical protein